MEPNEKLLEGWVPNGFADVDVEVCCAVEGAPKGPNALVAGWGVVVDFGGEKADPDPNAGVDPNAPPPPNGLEAFVLEVGKASC